MIVAARQRTWIGRQPCDSNFFLENQTIPSNMGTNIHRANNAERVPVIISTVTLKPSATTTEKTDILSFSRVSNNTLNGSVQTTNSAKKFRLTNVEAGLGPWAKS